MESLLMILISLVLSFILSQVFKKIGLPKVIGQITAGFILGIGSINIIFFSEENLKVLTFLANLGMILMFYYVGLQLDFTILTKYLKRYLIISTCKAVIPIILGIVIMKYILGFDLLVGLIVGLVLSAGAIMETASIIEELKILKTRISNALISISVITDIIELIIIGIIISLFEITTTNITISKFLINLILFVVFLFFAKIAFVPYIFKFFDKEKSSTSRFMFSLVLVFFIVLVAEFFNLSALIGAIVSGILIRHIIYKDGTIPKWEERDIARSIHIVAFGFLVPLFFVWVGVNTNFTAILTNYTTIIMLTIIALAGVIGGTVLGTFFTKDSMKRGVILGFGLSPKGDVGFVLSALALETGIINENLFSSIILMSIIVTIISTITFKKLVKNYLKK